MTLLLALVLALATAGAAEPRPQIPIPDLALRADVIVVGHVAVQRQVGTTLFLVLQPRRVLKGWLNRWLDDWASLIVTWDAPAPPEGLLDCPYGIWFLAHDRTSPWRWSVLGVRREPQLREAALPVPGGELPLAYRYSVSEVLIDRVADELWAGVDSGTDELAAAGLGALYALARDARDGPRHPAFEHWALGDPGHTQTCPVARAAREWDDTLVARLEDYLASTHAEEAPGLAALLDDLESPAVVPALLRIAAARPRGDLGWAVAKTLVRLHSPAAVVPLAGLLDDPDRRTRRGAIALLERVAAALRGGSLLPGLTPSDEDAAEPPTDPEEAEIAFWKAWLERHPFAGPGPYEPPAAHPDARLSGETALELGNGRSRRLDYLWPGGRWPAGCAAVVESHETPRWAANVACHALPARGTAGKLLLQFDVESHLCDTCRQTLRLVAVDAWGEQATARLSLSGAPSNPAPAPP